MLPPPHPSWEETLLVPSFSTLRTQTGRRNDWLAGPENRGVRAEIAAWHRGAAQPPTDPATQGGRLGPP